MDLFFQLRRSKVSFGREREISENVLLFETARKQKQIEIIITFWII